MAHPKPAPLFTSYHAWHHKTHTHTHTSRSTCRVSVSSLALGDAPAMFDRARARGLRRAVLTRALRPEAPPPGAHPYPSKSSHIWIPTPVNSPPPAHSLRTPSFLHDPPPCASSVPVLPLQPPPTPSPPPHLRTRTCSDPRFHRVPIRSAPFAAFTLPRSPPALHTCSLLSPFSSHNLPHCILKPGAQTGPPRAPPPPPPSCRLAPHHARQRPSAPASRTPRAPHPVPSGNARRRSGSRTARSRSPPPRHARSSRPLETPCGWRR